MSDLRLEEVLTALDDLPPVLELKEVAQVTALSSATIRRRVQLGELSAMRTCSGRGGRLRFMKGDKTASVLTVDGSLRAKDLAQLRDMLTNGQLKPTIDRTFGLDDTAEAIRYVEQGHVKGKVVITAAP